MTQDYDYRGQFRVTYRHYQDGPPVHTYHNTQRGAEVNVRRLASYGTNTVLSAWNGTKYRKVSETRA